jgi:arsenate reductase (thioredoxin)
MRQDACPVPVHTQLGPLTDGRGIVEGYGRDRFDVFSAGTEATRVRPEDISVVAEIGVDISARDSETLERYLGEPLDLVITVCDDANEACTIFPGARERLHWPFPDPSTAAGGYQERLRAFLNVRDEIRARIEGELAKTGL